MELSSSSIKKFLTFSQKKAFLTFGKWNFLKFWETEAPKKFLVFSQKKAFLIFGKTETPQKYLYFRKRKP